MREWRSSEAAIFVSRVPLRSASSQMWGRRPSEGTSVAWFG